MEAGNEESDQIIKVESFTKLSQKILAKTGLACHGHSPGQETRQKESLEELDSLLVKVKNPWPLGAKSVLAIVRVVTATTLI